jgi:hypothetical protein
VALARRRRVALLLAQEPARRRVETSFDGGRALWERRRVLHEALASEGADLDRGVRGRGHECALKQRAHGGEHGKRPMLERVQQAYAAGMAYRSVPRLPHRRGEHLEHPLKVAAHDHGGHALAPCACEHLVATARERDESGHHELAHGSLHSSVVTHAAGDDCQRLARRARDLRPQVGQLRHQSGEQGLEEAAKIGRVGVEHARVHHLAQPSQRSVALCPVRVPSLEKAREAAHIIGHANARDFLLDLLLSVRYYLGGAPLDGLDGPRHSDAC